MKYLLIIFMFVSAICFGQNPPTSGYVLQKANGAVSIGTEANTAPLTIANFSTSFPSPQTGSLLHLVSSATSNARISFDVYNSDNVFGAVYQGRRAGGTAGSPTAALADYTLAVFSGDGYGDDSYTGNSLGAMSIKSEGTMTNTSKPTYLSFLTTPSGATTASERMRIASTGAVRINNYGVGTFTGTAAYSLQVDASGNIIEGALGGGATWGSITGTLSSQTDLQSAFDGKQPLDADLTTIAGLTATTDNFIVSVTSAWASRTPAQVKTTLSLDNVTNESKATMFTNATFTGTFDVANGAIANADLANGAVANLSGTNTGDQTSIVGITGTTAQFNTALTDGDFTTLAGSETLTNKTLTTPIISSITNTGTLTLPTVTSTIVSYKTASEASSATPTPSGDARMNEHYVTALAANATFAAPSGTPTNGNRLLIRIEDNGTARTLAFNAIYRAGTDIPLPTTTILGEVMYLGFIYNSTDSTWDLIAYVDNI